MFGPTSGTPVSIVTCFFTAFNSSYPSDITQKTYFITSILQPHCFRNTHYESVHKLLHTCLLSVFVHITVIGVASLHCQTPAALSGAGLEPSSVCSPPSLTFKVNTHAHTHWLHVSMCCRDLFFSGWVVAILYFILYPCSTGEKLSKRQHDTTVESYKVLYWLRMLYTYHCDILLRLRSSFSWCL